MVWYGKSVTIYLVSADTQFIFTSICVGHVKTWATSESLKKKIWLKYCEVGVLDAVSFAFFALFVMRNLSFDSLGLEIAARKV